MGIDEQEKNIFGQTNKKDNRAAVSFGFNYTLPILIVFQAEVFHDGIVRLQLMRENIPITKRLRAGFMVNTDKEYMVELGYIINRFMRMRTHYDSDMGFWYRADNRLLRQTKMPTVTRILRQAGLRASFDSFLYI